MKRKNILCAVLLLLIFGQLFFIFSNSHKNAEESGKQSAVFVRFYLEHVEGRTYEATPQTHIDGVTHIIRKTAHFTEYAVLCFLVALFLRSLGAERASFIAAVSSAAGFAVGGLDELLQSFSVGRGTRFTDVLIDTSGGVFGCLCALLLLHIVSRIRKRSAQKRQKNTST